MKLSLLCISRCEPYALPFLGELCTLAHTLGAECVIAADGDEAFQSLSFSGLPCCEARVHSRGYLESVLEEAVQSCSGEYVLRLDDDERASVAMCLWLRDQRYLSHDHWQFPRAHMWPDDSGVLMLPQLYPDHQTRLSVKSKSGGRHTLHAMSPFGMGECAPVYIEHHKFLARTREEREETSRRWHSGGMRAFSLPEDVHPSALVVEAGSGFVPWTPKWTQEMPLVRP